MVNWEGPVTDVQIDQLDPMKIQPQERREKVPELAEDMKSQGLLQPIIITPCFHNGGVVPLFGKRAREHKGWRNIILDGHRRFWAAQLLEWKTIPARRVKDPNYLECLRIWAASNHKRLEPNGFGEYQFLVEVAGENARLHPTWTRDKVRTQTLSDVAMWTGKSYTYWVNRWKIGDETQPIQQMIATDRLGANVPAEMSRLPPLPRAIVREGFVEGKLINTLDPRSLADEWKAIQADPTVPTRDKPKRFKAVVDTFAGLDSPDKIPAETRFQKYLHELEGMRATILRWNVRGFTPKQLDQLAAKLHAVTNAFRSTRKQQGRLPHGKDHGGLP